MSALERATISGRVASSGLNRVDGAPLYRLQLVLQNRADVAVVSEQDPAESVAFHPLFGFGDDAVLFVRRLAHRGEPDLIELELRLCLRGHNQMANVRWVEGATEDANLHPSPHSSS